MSEKHWDKVVRQLPPRWTNSEGDIFETRRSALRAEATLYVMRRHLTEYGTDEKGVPDVVVDRNELVNKLPAMSDELQILIRDITRGDYDEGP